MTHKLWQPFSKKNLSDLKLTSALIRDPESEHSLRSEIAEEYQKDRQKFLQKAADFTAQHAEPR